MIKATISDKATIVKILCESFANNKSVLYITDGKASKTKALMEYSFNVCWESGSIFMSPDRKACALVMLSDKKWSGLRSIWNDLVFIIKGLGLANIGKALRREKIIKAQHPLSSICHLWYIGVEAKSQHLGIGSVLLADVLKDASSKNRQVFLETSTTRNLPWYDRFGLKEYKNIDIGYTLYFLSN